jgi:hypothetical protein
VETIVIREENCSKIPETTQDIQADLGNEGATEQRVEEKLRE